MRAYVVACLTVLAGCSAAGPRLGTPGESCRARNDCREDLACVRGVCAPGTTGLTVTGRDCYRVDCAADGDCCAAFVPDPSCDFYRANCEANPMDCGAFNTLCVCNQHCLTERCVDAGPACTADTDCAGIGFSHFCVAAHCVACREHGDCGATDRCVDGDCVSGCDHDENCGLMEHCEAGACVPGPCSTDRECAFLLGSGDAVCRDGSCAIRCTDDAECDLSRFEVCASGSCVFAGCTSDAECRAYLRLENTTGPTHAVCR